MTTTVTLEAEMLAESRAWIIAQNARTDRFPLCRACGLPIHPNDHGVFWPRCCSSCDFQRIWPLIVRLSARFGPVGARIKLGALARSRPEPSAAAIKAAALKRIARSEALAPAANNPVR